MARLHCESIYGFYHGQDPRTFSPDGECCTASEIEAHKTASAAADCGEWKRDDSGCHHIGNRKVLRSSFGLGVYHVVMNSEGGYIRDATYDDYSRHGEWEEEIS